MTRRLKVYVHFEPDFEEEQACKGRLGNFKISKLITLN